MITEQVYDFRDDSKKIV